MSAINSKLRKMEGGYGHWCPGCARTHIIFTERANSPKWSFDGNADSPTFNPSVRIRGGGDNPLVCHYFLHAGKIQFCSDSTHSFSGQTVDLPDFPPEENP